MGPPVDSDSPRHVIGVVARRTGLRPDRIRVWERRYGAVTPTRGAGGRRLYSDAAVRRLRLLREAVEQGRPIGSVARLDEAELLALIGADSLGSSAASGRTAYVEETLDTALDAIRRLDRAALERELSRAEAHLERADLLERLLAPLMERVGELWRAGALRPVQEHLGSAVLRSFVGRLMGRGRPAAEAPRVAVSTPRGQCHELGALVVAAYVAAQGWQPLYLGPSVPATEVAEAARIGRVRAVALSITYPPDDPLVLDELVALGRQLPAGVALLVGGRSAGFYGAAIEQAGGRLVEGLTELRERLDELGGGQELQPLR